MPRTATNVSDAAPISDASRGNVRLVDIAANYTPQDRIGQLTGTRDVALPSPDVTEYNVANEKPTRAMLSSSPNGTTHAHNRTVQPRPRIGVPTLNQGDSFSFESALGHRWYHRSTEETVLL